MRQEEDPAAQTEAEVPRPKLDTQVGSGADANGMTVGASPVPPRFGRTTVAATRASAPVDCTRLGIQSLFGWLVHEEVLLAGLCERKILFWMEIYDHLRQATAKRIDCLHTNSTSPLDRNRINA